MLNLRRAPIAGARKVLAGTGPGPRNVLVELPDGRRVVIPAGRWRFLPRGDRA